ncbi:MAG: transglycosylase family protein [Microthrixaceae bacterium]
MSRKSNQSSKRRPFRGPVAVATFCLAVAPFVSGSAFAAQDPVAAAQAELTAATAGRIAVEERIGNIKSQIQTLDGELAGMDEQDAQLTRDLAAAKDDMRQFAVAAYIDGRKAVVASASLDPVKSQALVWQSTLSVGQSASADEVSRRYEDLKAAVGPRREAAAQRLEDAKSSLVDANNDAIQASALERDAEVRLSQAKDEVRRRAAEERARARQAAAEQRAATAKAAVAPATSRTKAPSMPSQPAPDRSEDSGTPRGNPTAAESATLARIRRCESRGNYSVVSASGRYRGAYQFDYRTWAGMGGSGDPAAASPAEQDYRALLLLRSRGTRPWPVCGR